MNLSEILLLKNINLKEWKIQKIKTNKKNIL